MPGESPMKATAAASSGRRRLDLEIHMKPTIRMLVTCLLAITAFRLDSFGPAHAGEGDERLVSIATSKNLNVNTFHLSREAVQDAQDGSIRLAHSVLVADEMGATDFRQGEALSARVSAKKVFVLDSADVTDAELFLYGSARTIEVNGKALTGSERLFSTGFSRARVPPDYLKAGDNEVVFGGGGSLLIEPARQPGRSFKSNDASKTWTNRQLGTKDNLQGEYLVRLRLGRYARSGWAMTPILDLWSANSPIAVPGSLVEFALKTGMQPDGTKLALWIRTGSTPDPDGRHWTEWLALEKTWIPGEATRRHRWAQLRFDLSTSK